MRRLTSFLDPLVGGDDHQGWPFGEPLRPSVLLRESQVAVEDSAVVNSVAIQLLDTRYPRKTAPTFGLARTKW